MTLQELIDNRKALIQIHKDNNISEGISRLLTDLYASTGHFIYELLQNAEDMNATTVHFYLLEDKLLFEHNGTKRSFTLEDVDAITNIGYSLQKLHDPTSIGKFGVGFKSVFSYTSSPEIHSGQYHFIIEDYFVPKTEGVCPIDTIDSNGIEWTKFIIPFNNPRKTAETAFAEIENALKEIDDTAVLFLRNINNIEYTILGNTNGYSRKKIEKNLVSIEYCNTEKIITSYWLRYQKLVEINDEHNISKLLNIGVAYCLKKNNEGFTIKELENGGKTFIYFPAESEKSGLRFHINAPFASTVGRETIRECPENNFLFEEIAKLAAKSIEYVKQDGYLDINFLNVIPHDFDELDEKYSYIRDYMISVFYNNQYIPTITNEFTNAKNAVICNSEELRAVFDERLVGEILEKEVVFIKSPKRESNSSKLYKTLGVVQITVDSFKKQFINNTEQFEKIIGSRTNKWLKSFYELLYKLIITKEYHYIFPKKDDFYEALITAKIIRSKSNKMITPKESYYPCDNDDENNNDRLINKSLISGSNSYKELIYELFCEGFGIKELSKQTITEELLAKYPRKTFDTEEYLADILTFARYFEECGESKQVISMFSNKNFLIGEIDNKLYWTKANRLILGKEYGFHIGSDIISAIEISLKSNSLYLYFGITSEYLDELRYFSPYKSFKTNYSKQEFKIVKRFLLNLGAITTIELKKSKATDNPLFSSQLDTEARHTGYGVNEDYTFSFLEFIANAKSIRISLLIWNIIINLEDDCKTYLDKLPFNYYYNYNKDSYYFKYLYARYAPNGTASSKTCESSLVYYLKNNAWIPDEMGVFHTPSDISLDKIHPDFKYVQEEIEDDPIFKAIGLKTVKEPSVDINKLNQLKEEAEKIGYVLLTKDEYEKIKDLL